ncbi:MAG: type II toxin-antitoxin system VapC family toxin [Micrococcales bacterium]|nr:type II toxin-antitoxin system VapC family toxin [Micrococcales bacterium]
MILIDTNVLSELLRPAPDPQVLTWLAETDKRELATATPVMAELLLGVAALPAGKRRDTLAQAVATVLDSLAGRVWAFDEGAAAEYALIVMERRELGSPISTMDAQIAAIARSREAPVATRDVEGLACSGLTVVNPWV